MTGERQNLFEKLRGIDGREIGSIIAQDITLNQGNEELVVMGEAGMGKSALISSIRRLLGEGVHADYVWFEDAMDETEIVYGPRANWNNHTYDIMSGRFSTFLRQQDERRQQFKLGHPDIRWFGFAEAVGLGSVAIKNRAITSIEGMVSRQRQAGTNNTIYLAGPADPRSQKRAGEIRTALEESSGRGENKIYTIPDEEVVDYLLDQHNIRIVGIENYDNPGVLVRAVFGRQARMDRMMDISAEVLWAAQIWHRAIETRERVQALLEEVVLPPDLDVSAKETENYRLKASFIEYRMRDVLQLPEDKGRTVLNVFDPTVIVEMDMSPYIPAA